MRILRTGLVPLALVLAPPLAAQAPGLPVYGGGALPGAEVALMAGFPNADSWTGKGTTYGVTFTYGRSRFGVSGTVAGHDPSGSDGARPSLGALATVRLVGGGLDTPLAVSLLGGYGWLDRATGIVIPEAPIDSDWRVPLGAAFALTIATPVVSIQPWLAPRLELWSVTQNAATETESRFAGSAGVDLRFFGGFSLRMLYDGIADRGQTLGVGAAYRF